MRIHLLVDLHGLAVGLAAVDLLAGLLDGLEDGVVVERLGGDDVGGLGIK